MTTPVATSDAGANAARAAANVAPYRTQASPMLRAALLGGVNANLHSAHGPDYRLGGGPGKLVAAPLSCYERLLRAIDALPHTEFVSHRRALAEPCPPDRVRVLVRHDLDCDLNAAMAQARLERELGIETSYYVLHTAPYYGTFARGRLDRHDCVAALYRELQDLGHEVGLHTDGLHVYQQHGMDGAAAIRHEIAWLRSLGIELDGTLAHNSISAYGAANFAIFRGRPQGLMMDPAACPPVAEKDGRKAPLQVLDEAELGLTYEGNDVFWQRETPVAYGVAWSTDHWWWEDEKRTSVVTETPASDRTPGVYLAEDELLERVARVEAPSFLVLVVHPVYYGARHRPDRGPARRIDRRPVVRSETLGWETWSPYATVAIDTPDPDVPGRQAMQSINVANHEGMLHRPDSVVVEPTAPLVLALGGTNVDGAPIAVPSHALSRVADALVASGAPRRVRRLAHPGMGFGRCAGWYDAVAGELPAGTVVLIGVGADMTATSHPAGWRRTTGFHPDHAPGRFVDLVNGAAALREPGPAPALHRGGSQPHAMPSLAEADAAWPAPLDAGSVEGWLGPCLRWLVERVRADGHVPMLLIEECGESAGLWTPDTAADAHERLHACLRRLLTVDPVVIVDPYARMLAAGVPADTHLPDGTWSSRGHRMAAAAILEALAALDADAGAPETPA